MSESPLNKALRQFEIVDANLGKADRLLEQLMAAIPKGIVFGSSVEYDQTWREFHDIVKALPRIDGYQCEAYAMTLDEIAQARMDASEMGDVEYTISTETRIDSTPKDLAEYRYRFNKMRRALVRDAINEVVDRADQRVRSLAALPEPEEYTAAKVDLPEFLGLKDDVAELAVLLGSAIPKPPRWPDLTRHLAFGQQGDLQDIVKHDWPAVRAGLHKVTYAENEPVPVEVQDLANLVKARPTGRVASQLTWSALDDEGFERLIFALIASANGYENAQWLMHTNAADRGRDLSADRVATDSLAGTLRQRAIIQCKHWQKKSFNVADFAQLKEQIKLWEPPRVDICVIASSGRFSPDVVAAIEKHNQSDSAVRFEMWPESHLERLLAMRPDLIGEFGLR